MHAHLVPFLKLSFFNSEMEITVNNEKKTTDQKDLESLLTEIVGDKTKGIAVAINSQVIPKTNWKNTGLKEQDSIIIIKATQGG